MPWLVASGFYLALAVLMTWPLATHLATAFPHDAFDPALNAWILWWNSRAVPLTTTWWNAPNFWPLSGALSLSEHLLGISIVTTPLLWSGIGPVTAYNLALLLSYVLTALAAHALAFTLVRRHDAALLAGLILGFSPYRVAQLAHLQMLWVFGMPLALLAAHQYLERGARRWLVVFGAAWLVLALANSYYLLFFPILFAAWILWFGRCAPRRAAAILGTWVVSSLPLVPILLTYSSMHRALNLVRRFDEIDSFGADLMAIVTTTPEMRVWHGLSTAGRGEGQLFPGAVALVLAGVGIVLGLRARRERRLSRGRVLDAAPIALIVLAAFAGALAISPLLVGPWQFPAAGVPVLSVSSPEKPLAVSLTMLVLALAVSATFADLWRRQSAPAFYTLAAVAMWTLSWGPHPRAAGAPILYRGPYAWLLRLPGLSEVRVPARFGMLLVVCLAVAAALAFARIAAALTPRASRAFAAVCAAIIVAESWPAILLVAPAAPIAALQRTDLSGPVLELPLGESWLDAPAQFRTIAHGRPVVNGYSGYAPPHYRLLQLALHLDDFEVIKGLTSTSPLVVVLNRREEVERWRRVITGVRADHVVDEDGLEIYRVPAEPLPAARLDGSTLPIRAMDASAGADRVGNMTDGNLKTIWNSQRVQAGGEFVILDLGSDRSVDTIRITSAEYVSDYPRRLSVDCAADGADWSPCWSGSIAGLLLRSVLEHAPTAAASIPIHRDHVRRIRLTQTAVDPTNGWSIAELAVLGR